MTPNPLVMADIARWKSDIVYFCSSELKFIPDIWQEKALKAFADSDTPRMKIALSACAGPGKTGVIACMILWFITCCVSEGEHPRGAAMSESWTTLQNTLWSEVGKWMDNSPFLMSAFVWTRDRLYARDHHKTWFVEARSYSQKANEEEQGRTLSGIHSQNIAYFIDESGDTSINVLKSCEQGLSNCTFGRVVTGGNPTSHGGLLYHAVEEDFENWHVIRITGDPEDPERSPRIGLQWAKDQIAKYGREDSWVMSYILGKFPKGGINSLLSPQEVREAIDRGNATDLNKEMYKYSQKRLGIDVALYGDDCTVIFPRQGLRAFNPVVMRDTASDGQAPSMIAARAIEAKNTWGSEMEFIDCTGGYGDGVVNYMMDAGADPIRVVYSSKASDSNKYYNKRTEMYFLMRDWVRRGGILPNDTDLIKELSMPTYALKGGKLLLEPKEKIKERLKRSPDKADALCQTFALPDMQADLSDFIPGLKREELRQSSDWDVD